MCGGFAYVGGAPAFAPSEAGDTICADPPRPRPATRT